MNKSSWKIIDWDELEYNGNGYTYDGEYFSGLAYEDTSTEYIRQTFLRGSEHGLLRIWNQDKVLIEEVQMEYGTVHGMELKWYPNGRPKEEIKAERGIVVQKKVWDEQGNLVEEFNISEGHPRYKTLQIRRNTNFPDRSQDFPPGALDFTWEL